MLQGKAFDGLAQNILSMTWRNELTAKMVRK